MREEGKKDDHFIGGIPHPAILSSSLSEEPQKNMTTFLGKSRQYSYFDTGHTHFHVENKRVRTDKQFSLEQCAHFLYTRLYVKSHFRELSHSFRMTAAGRPLQPHPMSFLPRPTHPKSPLSLSLSLLSTRISLHTLHPTHAGSKQE